MYLLEDDQDKIIAKNYRFYKGTIEIKEVVFCFPDNFLLKEDYVGKEYSYFGEKKHTKIIKIKEKQRIAIEVLYGGEDETNS